MSFLSSKFGMFSFVMITMLSTKAYSQIPCMPAPSDITVGVVGEPNNIVVPVDQEDVYTNGRQVPTFREMVGVNLLKGNENNFNDMDNLTDMFSYARLFQFMNKDYWDDGVGEPNSGDPSSYRIFRPFEDRDNLKLAVDVDGKPLNRNSVLPGDRLISYDLVTKDLVEEPLTSVLNVYQNYMNQNWHHAVSVFDEFQAPSQVSLTVVPANFPPAIQGDYSFPSQWWTESDWGADAIERREAARAYALIFARTYAPKASDCSTCSSIVSVLEVGNEPWTYSQDVYHAVIEGMIDGIEEYYASDPTNKLKLLPAAFQAQHQENSNPAGFNYLDWKDYQGTRIPEDMKCYLHGTNLHPYSNDLADVGGGFYNQRLTAEPEKSSSSNAAESKYLFIKNAWKWGEENMPIGSQHYYISEFGWDSEVPECPGLNVTGVGPEAQGLYISRAILMAGRTGAHRATAYEAIDNFASPCDFAYHSSGLWARSSGTVTEKESKKTIHKLIELVGDLRFHKSLVESNGEEFAYILEDVNGNPTHMVGWLAQNVNNQDWATIKNSTNNSINLNLMLNGDQYQPDVNSDWYYLDNNITTDGNGAVTNLFEIPDVSEAYNVANETFTFSPVPVLIPIMTDETVELICEGSITSISCFGGSDGNIDVTIIGGMSPYSFVWSHDITEVGSTLSNVSAGNYSVEVMDVNGVVTTCNFEMLDGDAIQINDVELTATSCGNSNGSLTINASPKNGQPNSILSYSIDNGNTFQSSNYFDNLGSGDFDILVEDLDGCTSETVTTINESNALILAVESTCFGAGTISLNLTVSDGPPPFEYEWEGPSGLYSTEDLTNVPQGTYYVTVTASNNCTALLETTLQDCCIVDDFCESIIVQPNCTSDQGMISIMPSGGSGPYEYLWEDDSNLSVLMNASPGIYSVTVTDNIGCSSVCTATIENQPTIAIDDLDITNPSCGLSNGTIIINATPKDANANSELEYSIDSGVSFQMSNTFSNVPSGSYTVMIQDFDLCTVSMEVLLSDSDGPMVAFNSNCVSAGLIDIDITISGGVEPYSILWMGPSGTFNTEDLLGVNQGTYTLEITDANDCTVMESITQSNCCNTDDFCTSTIVQPICNGDLGSITINPNGGNTPYSYVWQHDGTLEGNTQNVSSGAYSIEVVDNLNCSSICSFTINEIESILITNINTTNATCGVSNGAISIAASPKDASTSSTLSYSIDNGVTFQANGDFSMLSAQNYIIVVEDEDGCMTSSEIELSNSDGLSFTSNEVCDDNGLINIDITISTGTPPFQYFWSGPSGSFNTEDLIGVLPGTYTIEISDANNCSIESSITKTDCCNSDNFCLATVVQPICSNDFGSIHINPIGGSGMYSYEWSHDEMLDTNLASDLSSGMYTIEVIDALNCIALCNYTIQNPGSITIETVSIISSTCGSSNGSITIEAVPGAIGNALNYSIDGGFSTQESNVFNGLSSGSYSIVVSNSNGCTITDVAMVNDAEGPEVSIESACNFDGLLDINLTVQGGEAPYDYQWVGTGGAYSSEDLLDVIPGTYQVLVTDINGCNASISITQDECCITENFCEATIVQPTCDHSFGTILITADGGSAPYEFSWNHDASINVGVLENVVAGTYTVNISDALNCETSCSYIIEEEPSLVISSITSEHPTCGNTNGSLNIQVNNSTDVNYSIDGGITFQQNALFENIPSGIYNVVVTNGENCQDERSIELQNDDVFEIDIVAVCGEAENINLDLTINGGLSPFTITWQTIGQNYTTEDLTNVSPGTYTVTVIDANNCSNTTSITKTDCCDPSDFCSSTLIQPICQGDDGEITISPVGGVPPFTYQWSHDASIFTDSQTELGSGNYTVTISDNNDCSTICSYSIESIQPITITNIEVQNATCINPKGEIQIFAQAKDGLSTSALSYSIDGGLTFSTNATFTDVEVGSYAIIVEDQDGCIANGLATIEVSNSLAVNLQADCLDAGIISIISSISGGIPPYSYQWTGPNGFLSNEESLQEVSVGTYELAIQDANGCSGFQVVTKHNCCENDEDCVLTVGDFVWNDLNGNGIQDDDEPGVSNVTISLYTCQGDFISQTNTNSNGNYLFSDLLAGQYYLSFSLPSDVSSFMFSKKNEQNSSGQDSDVNSNGQTDCFLLMEGQSDISIDAGIMATSGIGNFVWEDLNGNGIQDSGEPPVANFRVELHAENGDFVASTYSDINGHYLFDEVTPGDYYLQYFPTNFAITFGNQGSDDNIDSDVDGSNGMGTTQIFSIVPGEQNLNFDVGLYKCVSVGNYVWYDANKNDLQDANESGINNVGVEVYKETNTGFELFNTFYTGINMNTGKSGHWMMCIPPGDYYFKYTSIPEGMVAVCSIADVPNVNSDITFENGENTTDVYSFLSKGENVDIDAGFYEMASLKGSVWLDQNIDGIQDMDENYIDNVSLHLYCKDDNSLKATVETNAEGDYCFDHVRKGEYYIEAILPDGFSITIANAGNGDNDNDIDNSNGLNTTQCFSLSSGTTIVNVDVGIKYNVLPLVWGTISGTHKYEFNEIKWNLFDIGDATSFNIERSMNGVDFETIGELSMVDYQTDYAFNDFDIIEEATYYYRVVSLNDDRILNTSSLVSIEVSNDDFHSSRILLFPNPTFGPITLEVELSQSEEKLTFDIYNSAGQNFVTNQILGENLEAGLHKFKMNVVDLPAGYYQLLIKGSGQLLLREILIKE